MTFSAWLSLLVVCLLGAISPGPSLAMIAKNTLGGNKFNGLLSAWTHALGIGIYATLTLFGLAIVLQNTPNLFYLLTYAGALYLAWLGIQALFSKEAISSKLKYRQTTSYIESMRDGFMISLLNPKIGLFFLALFSQFIHTDVSWQGKTLTILTPILVDGLWYSLITLILSIPKVLNTLHNKAIWIDRLMGVIFISLALQILFKSG